jgi:hypothetical protein
VIVCGAVRCELLGFPRPLAGEAIRGLDWARGGGDEVVAAEAAAGGPRPSHCRRGSGGGAPRRCTGAAFPRHFPFSRVRRSVGVKRSYAGGAIPRLVSAADCVNHGTLGSARFRCTGLFIVWSSCGCLDLWSISPHAAGGRARGASGCFLTDDLGLSFITLVSCNFVRIPSDLSEFQLDFMLVLGESYLLWFWLGCVLFHY